VVALGLEVRKLFVLLTARVFSFHYYFLPRAEDGLIGQIIICLHFMQVIIFRPKVLDKRVNIEPWITKQMIKVP
jgi:hypothetical protein